MDENTRRFILFFALSFGVLMLWQKFFMPQRPEAVSQSDPSEISAPSPESGELPRPAPSDPLVQAAPSTQVESAAISRQPEKVIEIESPLFRARINTNGGRLEGWELRNFSKTHDPDSGPFDLIPHKDARVLVDHLKLGSTDLLAGQNYEYNGPGRIVLDESQPEAEVRLTLQFRAEDRTAVLVKTYRFQRDHYGVDMSLHAQGFGPMSDSEIYWTWSDHVASTHSSFMGIPSPTGGGGETPFLAAMPVILLDKSFKQLPLGKLAKGYQSEDPVGWIGMTRDYFFFGAAPLDADANTRVSATGNEETGDIEWKLTQAPPSSGDFERNFRLYLGPRDRAILQNEGNDFDRVLDQVFLSGLTRPIVGPMTAFIKAFHKYAIPNYGVAIVMLTLLVKIIFFPLTRKSMLSMKAMKRIQPEMQALKEKHKGDPSRMNQEVMKLYKDAGVNPLGGCLPVLIQLPIFIALYSSIIVSIELRHAPFFLWINDLSQPDLLMSIAGLPIRLLPIVMGVTMLVSQKLTPMAGVDPMQQKILNLMPVFFTFISWGFPSGLVLYWIVNNLLQIVQQQVINRSTSAPAR